MIWMDLAFSFFAVGNVMTLKDMEDCTACPYAELAERAVLYLAQRSADVTGSSWVSSRGILMVWFHYAVNPCSSQLSKGHQTL